MLIGEIRRLGILPAQGIPTGKGIPSEDSSGVLNQDKSKKIKDE